MDKSFRGLTTTVSAVAAGTVVGVIALAQPAPLVQRSAADKPDLNGIWQALNEANYDLEAHIARPAMALRPGPYGPIPASPVLALGAVGAVPPGLGVVEGVRNPVQARSPGEKKSEPTRLVEPRS